MSHMKGTGMGGKLIYALVVLSLILIILAPLHA